MTDFVNQKGLALDLGLSARRVRQLIAAKVLPEAGDEGYDLERCRSCYELYSFGTDADWHRFYERIEHDAGTVERLVRRAVSPRAGRPELGKAGAALARLFDDLRFITACRSQCAAERDFVMRGWDREEAVAFAPLITRATECMEIGKPG